MPGRRRTLPCRRSGASGHIGALFWCRGKGGTLGPCRVFGAAWIALWSLSGGLGEWRARAADAADPGQQHVLAGQWSGYWTDAAPDDEYLRVRLDVHAVEGDRAQASLVYEGHFSEFRRAIIGKLREDRATFQMADGQRVHVRLGGPDRLRLSVINPRSRVRAILYRDVAAKAEATSSPERPAEPDRADRPDTEPQVAAFAAPPAAQTVTPKGAPDAVDTQVDLGKFGVDLALPEAPDPTEMTVETPLAASFAGVWVGRWGNAADAALIIEDVTERGAQVTYAAEAEGGDDTAHVRKRAAFVDGVLAMGLGDGRQLRLMRTGPEVLDATYHWADAESYATFLRVRAPVLDPAISEDAKRELRLTHMDVPPVVRVGQLFEVRLGFEGREPKSVERACVSFGGEPQCWERLSIDRERSEIVLGMRYGTSGDFTLSAYVDYRTRGGLRKSNTVAAELSLAGTEPADPVAISVPARAIGPQGRADIEAPRSR